MKCNPRNVTVQILSGIMLYILHFLFRYVEEHVQKTGVAIETQGFSFITSGRKRESLTVRSLTYFQTGESSKTCNIHMYLINNCWLKRRELVTKFEIGFTSKDTNCDNVRWQNNLFPNDSEMWNELCQEQNYNVPSPILSLFNQLVKFSLFFFYQCNG